MPISKALLELKNQKPTQDIHSISTLDEPGSAEVRYNSDHLSLPLLDNHVTRKPSLSLSLYLSLSLSLSHLVIRWCLGN